MKQLALLLISLFILVSCTETSKSYLINGVTSEFNDGTIIYLSVGSSLLDSTRITSNKFQFKGRMEEEYLLVTIHTEGYKNSKRFWMVNNEMSFDSHETSFNKAKISGSIIQAQEEEWYKRVEIWDKKGDSIRSVLKITKEENLAKTLRQEMEIFRKRELKEGINYIEDYPSYHLSSYFLSFLKFKIPEEQTRKLYNNLSKNVQSNEWGKGVAFYLNNTKDLKLGDEFIDFSLPDPEGKSITLSSFKGKYVLLEFWAKWCTPCRDENPNLLKSYQKYKNNGYEIVGISLDTNKEDWLDVIEKYSVIWTTLSDLEGIRGKVPLTYRVSYIPKNYLIDPTGKIIALDLRGEKLQEELKKIFRE